METESQSQPRQPENVTKKEKIFNIGIIVNDTNSEDIEYYNEQFREINNAYGEKVKLVFFGYKEKEDKYDILRGVDYSHMPPVSVVHYFKQLQELNFDFLFIPLINNIYNSTSENYNKFLELAIYKIPVITVNIYPYNTIIRNEFHGFIYQSRETFVETLRNILDTPKLPLIKLCGSHAHDHVISNFNFSEYNIKLLSNVFSVPVPQTASNK